MVEVVPSLAPALVRALFHPVHTGEETRTNHVTILTEVIEVAVLAAVVAAHAVLETRIVLLRVPAPPFADQTAVARGDARQVTSVEVMEDGVVQDLLRIPFDPAGLAASLVHVHDPVLVPILRIRDTAGAEVVPDLSAGEGVAAAVEMTSETAGQGHQPEKISSLLSVASFACTVGIKNKQMISHWSSNRHHLQ